MSSWNPSDFAPRWRSPRFVIPALLGIAALAVGAFPVISAGLPAGKQAQVQAETELPQPIVPARPQKDPRKGFHQTYRTLPGAVAIGNGMVVPDDMVTAPGLVENSAPGTPALPNEVNQSFDEERRWLPGYRPGTPEARAAYQSWIRQERERKAEYARGLRRPAPGTETPGDACPAIDEGTEYLWEDRSLMAARTPIGAEDGEDEGDVSSAPLGQVWVTPAVEPDSPIVVAGLPDETHTDFPPFLKKEGAPFPEDVMRRLRREAELAPPTEDMQRDPYLSKNPLMEVNAPGGPSVNWSGPNASNSGGGAPPDNHVAVGANHVMVVVNTIYRIYSKTGTQLASSSFNTFFGSTTNCSGAGTFLYDPSIDYDQENDRWVVMILNGTSSTRSYMCVGVSQTGDPTGAWNRYAFKANNGGNASLWLDNVEVAVGPDAIYAGGSLFTDPGSFSTAIVYAMQKTQMYSGAAASMVERNVTQFNPQPMHMRGYAAGQFPPGGRPFVFAMGSSATTLTLGKWTAPFGANTFTTNNITVSSGAGIPPSAAQSGAGGVVDSGDNRWLDVDYRYRSGSTPTDRLWLARNLACNAGPGSTGCIHWVEIDPVGNTVIQQQVYNPDTVTATWRMYPALTVDKNNSMMVGFSRTNASQFIETRVTGRDVGDPVNTLQTSESVLKAGEATYDDGSTPADRWGDYLGADVDPDGCRLWFFGEYAESSAAPAWGTWVGAYQFASCSVTSSIALDSALYTCNDSLTVTITDVTAEPNTWPASRVTLTTSTGDSETIAAVNWTGSNCTGPNCTTWSTTIPVSGTGSGNNNGTLNVVNGGTITATYADNHGGHTTQTRIVSVDCQPDVVDGGYLIDGGCDEGDTGPEKYVHYMDNGEVVSYTFGFFNELYTDLTDVQLSLSKSGAGAGAVNILSPTTVNIGRVQARSVGGAVFQISVTGAAALSTVTLTGAITSPADGYTTPINIAQVQILEADDNITQQSWCRTHDGVGDTSMSQAAWTAYGITGFTWANVNSSNCGSGENRTDGTCDSATTGFWKTTGTVTGSCNAAIAANTAKTLWPATPIALTNTGNAGNGQPWRYSLKRISWYAATYNSTTNAVRGVDYVTLHDDFPSTTQATDGGDALGWPIGLLLYDLWYTCCGATPSAWNWETANTGTPDVAGYTFCGTAGTEPPNQWNICLVGGEDAFGNTLPPGETGTNTASRRLNFSHAFADCNLWYSSGCDGTNPTIGIDNSLLLWEEFHAQADAGSCAVQCGTVSFDRFIYSSYPTTTATITVLDTNGVSPLTVSVTGSSGDVESVTLTGTAPYFTGTLPLSWSSGGGSGDGTLLVLPTDNLYATYNDANRGDGSPCSNQTWAGASAPGGDVVYVSSAVDATTSNGDDDKYADSNETIGMNITIRNDMATPLLNTVVTISTVDPDIDCVIDDTITVGTLAAGGSFTSTAADQVSFHVGSSVSSPDPANPATARFNVYITGTDFAGSTSNQFYTLDLDLNVGPSGTKSFNFNGSDPGWATFVGPADEDGACNSAYVNDFHWCAVCGNGNGGYGAWNGNAAFNTAGQTYRAYSNSVLESPVFTAGAANPVLSFDRAYGAETNYDVAAVQVSVNSGAWNYLTFTGMTANVNPDPAYCNPLDSGVMDGWTNSTAQVWGTSGNATITAAIGNTIKIRWRLGADSTVFRAGFGVDNVNITNLETAVTDAANNSALPGCVVSSGPKPVPDGDFVSGTPLGGTEGSGANVTTTWDVATCTAQNYNLYGGNIGSYSSFTWSSCAIGTTGSTTLSVSNDRWWIIAGTDNASVVSSFGKDSDGVEQAFTGWGAGGQCPSFTTKDATGLCN